MIDYKQAQRLLTGHARSLGMNRRPGIALLTTGDEVVPAADTPTGVQIRNSNRWLIDATLQKNGFSLSACDHSTDDPMLLKTKIASLLSHDVLILCGGVSAGDADHVPAALESLGVTKLFYKVAIKPGKPTWCGIIDHLASPEARPVREKTSVPEVAPGGEPRRTIVFALPGNPLACLVNLILLIQPYLRACQGLRPTEPLGLPMGASRKKRPALDEFFPVYWHGSPARVVPVSINGSGDIRLGMQANALALHPAGCDHLAIGTPVLCYSFI
ncbi:MAG TPA: molybdopterin-binding protein [Puia sp.]|nr:molybdopterin-binding protein [Puia sp.]